MKTFSSTGDAIIDLHERGFTEDFDQCGNTLLWIQQKTHLKPEDFFMAECHRFHTEEGRESTVFGIILNQLLAKGILMTNSNKTTALTDSIVPTEC